MLKKRAATFLMQAQELVERAKKKLISIKGVSVNQEIYSILHELNEAVETLKDPQNDPE